MRNKNVHPIFRPLLNAISKPDPEPEPTDEIGWDEDDIPVNIYGETDADEDR